MKLLRKLLMVGAFIILSASTVRELTGVASIYHNKFQNHLTSTGEKFKQEGFTCASNNFSLGTMLKVTNIKTGCDVVVRVNDRMAVSSQMKGRIVDLSLAAAREIDFNKGLLRVNVRQI